MKIRIDDITPGGLAFDKSVSQAQLDGMLTGARTGYSALAAVTVEVRLSRAGERIIVEGSLSTRVELACRRCLGPIPHEMPSLFRIDLRPLDQRSEEVGKSPSEDTGVDGERDGSFPLEEADREYYDGDTVDMLPILREQLLLSLPDYPLCGEECKGLCQSCGADLNTQECGCDRRVVDPRWADLAKMKIP